MTSTLREYCHARGEPERFLIHHGNLSTALRQDAEAMMKDEDALLSTCTTATLELGIDIGRLERAFQINAPFTVSGFLQRLGRTGRRGSPPEMRFVMREEEPEPRAILPATLPWELVHGVGLVESYREDRWVEPPRAGRLPYSLLFHQTLAVLAGEGELTPPELARRVLTLSPFAGISADDYRVLLRHMLAEGLVDRTETGGLIVGLEGERITSGYRFYAVFQENEEFAVRCGSRELGTLVQPPPAGERIAIAGRVWRVEEVDIRRRTVWCSPAKGRVPAFFGLCAGDIHTHILEKMCEVLRDDRDYPYLMPGARRRLAEAREAARRSGLVDTPLVGLGGGFWCLAPWLGTYGFLALERLIRLHAGRTLGIRSLEVARPWYMVFTMEADAPAFFRTLADRAAAVTDPAALLYPGEVPVFEKYDRYLPEELVRKGFARGVLGFDEMRARVFGWAGRSRGDGGGLLLRRPPIRANALVPEPPSGSN